MLVILFVLVVVGACSSGGDGDSDTSDDDDSGDDDDDSGENWCEGYVGNDACCKLYDPCGWSGNGVCNCDDHCDWDWSDCHGDDDDDAEFIACAVGEITPQDSKNGFTHPLILERYDDVGPEKLKDFRWFEHTLDIAFEQDAWLSAVAFPAHDIGWAVGGIESEEQMEGLLLQFDGEAWSIVDMEIDSEDYTLTDLVFQDASTGWAIGSNLENDTGLVLSCAQDAWSEDPESGLWSADFVDVEVCPDGTVFVAGRSFADNKAILLKRNPGSGIWSEEDLPFVWKEWALYGVSCPAANEAYATGITDDHEVDTFLIYDGSSWQDCTGEYPGIWDAQPSDIAFLVTGIGWIFYNTDAGYANALYYNAALEDQWYTVQPITEQYDALIGAIDFSYDYSVQGFAVGWYPVNDKIRSFIMSVDSPAKRSWSKEDEPVLLSDDYRLHDVTFRPLSTD